MKSILLATTASFAFAGMAAAEAHTGISFSGDFTLGYNDTDLAPIGNDEDNVGFYWSASLTVSGATELDNGLTAGFSTSFDILDDADGLDSGIVAELSGYEFSLTGAGAGLYVGDTDVAAEVNFSSVSGSEAGFYDRDDFYDNVFGDDQGAIIRGEYATDMYAVALSYGIDVDGPSGDQLVGLQLSASADVGPVTVAMAYQQEDFGGAFGETLGLSVGGTFGGADVKVSYVDQADDAFRDAETSTGIEIAYPVGPVTIGAYYTMNDVAGDFYGVSAEYSDGPIAVSVFYDDEAGEEDYGIEGTYDVGNGITLWAGAVDSFDDYYVAATYDLGGGAELLVSYAEDSDGDEADDDDDIGAADLQVGTTVQVTFEF